jgi:hypothetical protein
MDGIKPVTDTLEHRICDFVGRRAVRFEAGV